MSDASDRPDPFPSDADVDAVLQQFDGDAREAIRALLADLDALARDYERQVSRGVRTGADAVEDGGLDRRHLSVALIVTLTSEADLDRQVHTCA